jgi:hypothetical protein
LKEVVLIKQRQDDIETRMKNMEGEMKNIGTQMKNMESQMKNMGEMLGCLCAHFKVTPPPAKDKD